MSLTEQEIHCVGLAGDFLSNKFGGRWAITQDLDQEYPDEPSPEVIISNGSKTAGVEVKRLTGDAIDQAYRESILSNERYLAPSCGGYYRLDPPIDYKMPMEGKLRRYMKRQIELLAPSLGPGEFCALPVPRQGNIALIAESGPAYVMCNHGGPCWDFLRPLLERVEGQFMLVDEGLEHKFVTDEGRNAFYDAVVKAYHRRLEGDSSPFCWDEEWMLERIEDGDAEDEEPGVWMLVIGEVRPVYESAAACIDRMLESAVKKFNNRRWADLHVIVLETSIHAREPIAMQIIAEFDPADFRNVDLVLLADGDSCSLCYPTLPSSDKP